MQNVPAWLVNAISASRLNFELVQLLVWGPFVWTVETRVAFGRKLNDICPELAPMATLVYHQMTVVASRRISRRQRSTCLLRSGQARTLCQRSQQASPGDLLQGFVGQPDFSQSS